MDANHCGCCLVVLLGSPLPDLDTLELAAPEFEPEVEDEIEVDQQVLQKEVVYLRCLAIDYAVQSTFGDSPEGAAVLTAFWAAVRAAPLPWAELCQRLTTYTEAANTQHEMGVGWNVGKAFADNCCGNSFYLPLVLLGSMEWAGTIMHVSGSIGSKTIVVGNSDLNDLVARLRHPIT